MIGTDTNKRESTAQAPPMHYPRECTRGKPGLYMQETRNIFHPIAPLTVSAKRFPKCLNHWTVSHQMPFSLIFTWLGGS